MTGKRFKLRLSKLGNGMITDTQKRDDLYFDKEFLDATLPKVTEWLNTLNEENEQLKKELSEYKDFVLSDDKILCYTCLFCTHKGIYEVDCDVKGHVDVHGTCHCYTQKELQE